MKPIKQIFLLLLLTLLPLFAHAGFPRPTGFVNDLAGIIEPNAHQALESKLSGLENQTGIELAVVTVKSLDGEPIQDYAVGLFKNWGIGKKGPDNGILMLVAPAERKIWIEVGYGLEGTINDALAGRIIREDIIPRFKASDMTAGITSGVDTIINILSGKGVPVYNKGTEKRSSALAFIGKMLFLFLVMYLFIRHPWLFLFFLMSGRGGRSGSGFGGFSGGGFGGFSSGGFGGFGGGSSGGGGVGGSW